MSSAPGPSQTEKEHALSEVLDSQAFARSEQLKNFLRYVCELEISGRASEIKEYSIGTEALGRPDSYSPANDSSVRRRAFELRAKLEELYTKDLAASPVLIELPKGSYVPIFRFRAEEKPAVVPPPQKFPSLALAAAALLTGLILGAAGMRYLGSAIPGSRGGVLQEAWGPLAEPQTSVLVSIASNFHMSVRSGPFSSESDLPSFPAPPGIAPYFQKTNPWPNHGDLIMRPDLNIASLGVVGGVAAVASTLRMLGVHYQILPERSAPLSTFRGRNVVLFGDPINSFAAAQLLNRSRLTVAVNAGTNRLVIRDRTAPPSAPPVFSRREGRPGEPAEVFGLLTVMPTDAEPGQHRRTLIVSGISNVGIHGVMEFFTSPERLQDLKNRFRHDGLAGFPKSYQLVVRCTAQDSLPLSCGYAAHYVLEP